MDPFADELRDLDKSFKSEVGRLLSADAISRLAVRRRSRQVQMTVSVLGLVTTGLLCIGVFSLPADRPASHVTNALIVDVDATRTELEQVKQLRTQTEHLLRKISKESEMVLAWGEPFEDVSMTALFYAKQLLDLGADPSVVRTELEKLQILFPHTSGANQAARLAADISQEFPTYESPIMHSDERSSRLTRPTANQIASF